MHNFEDKVLLLLVACISLLFGWVLWPFAGAILWAVVLAILFFPLNQRLLKWMPRRRNAAALLSLLVIVVIVFLPVALVISALTREVADLYGAFQSGELSIDRILQGAREALPGWASRLPDRLSAPDLAQLPERLSSVLMDTGRFLARQALSFGKGTISAVIGLVVVMYLLFYLLRDGDALMPRVGAAVPLRAEHKSALAKQFTMAVQAIVRGSVVIAAVRGTLGGLAFWFLGVQAPLVWGVAIAVFSLLPIVGTAMIWVPVAAYLVLSGSVWQGIFLVVYSLALIEMADTVLRPILVGRGAHLPDYVVLISTLGGLSVFGANGFVVGPVIAALFLATWRVFSAWRAQANLAEE